MAGLSFNASLTATMIAPNPWTVGFAIGTGTVYAGLEIYNNWDQIGPALQDGWNIVGTTMNQAAGGANELAEDAVGTVRSGFTAINPFD